MRAAKRPDVPGLDPRPPEELFDLRQDPTEKNNLADKPGLADVKKELKSRLAKWRAETNDPLLLEED